MKENNNCSYINKECINNCEIISNNLQYTKTDNQE